MDCDNLNFSQEFSAQRIAKAEETLGKTLVRKILAFALFLLGVDRASIATRLGIPPGTLRSLVRSFNNKGITTLFDRRTKTLLPKADRIPEPEPSAPFLETDDEYLKVDLAGGNRTIRIPLSNHVQKRIVLLTLLNSKILKRSEVATALELSEDRTLKLAGKLKRHGAESIVDQRRGQQTDFRFTPRLKSEIIQQFVVDIVTEGRTTGEQLARHLEERCRITLSSRSILHHLSKLGLRHIRSSLPRLLEEAKKKIAEILKSGAAVGDLGKLVDTYSRRSQPRLLLRMKTMALMDSQYSELAVASILGLHPTTVSRWNDRFRTGGGIRDRSRSGRPSKITFETAQRIIAFYCQKNPLPGCSGWSVRWMAVYFRKHPEYLDVRVSAASIHRCLTSNRLGLYRRKYFLQICDPYFFEKMEKIIRVYKADPEYLFCLDECTGLQALERIAPDLPADPIHPGYREFEYRRHGTVSIVSILEKRTGKVFTECIPDHTSKTIIDSVKRHANRYGSSKTLHYICDNYSSHSTEEFCEGIAELCNVRLPKLEKVHDRKQWLEWDGKRIVFHFLPSHGSWLNLVEIWFSILKRKALSEESFASTVQKENHILDFTETWNTYFAHPFEWTYSGKDLYGKAVRRLIKWLELETVQMTANFLEKQLKLMNNLCANHYRKVEQDSWDTMRTTLDAKKDYVYNIVENIDSTENKNAESQRSYIRALYIVLTAQLDVLTKAS